MSCKVAESGIGSPESKYYGIRGQYYYDRQAKELWVKDSGPKKRKTKTGWRRIG